MSAPHELSITAIERALTKGKPAGSVGVGAGTVDVGAVVGTRSDAAAADEAHAASQAPDATRPLDAEPAAQPAAIATAASARPSRTAPTPPRVVRSKSLILREYTPLLP